MQKYLSVIVLAIAFVLSSNLYALAEEQGENKSANVTVTVDQKELQKALEDKIRHGGNMGENRWFYVRDTARKGGAHCTFDFWLVIDPGGKRTNRLNLSVITGVPGWHHMKEAAIVVVDGNEWLLANPVPPGATSFPFSQTFSYSFDLPEALLQAIINTQNGVTVKWNFNKEDRIYMIPAQHVRAMALMYAGCK